MRVTVVFADKRVVVDGVAYTVSMPSVEGHAGIVSITWDGETGELDKGDGSLPEKLGSEDYGLQVIPYVRAWQEADTAEKKRVQQDESAMWAMYNSPEALQHRLRKERNKRLAETDYVFQPDYPVLTDESLAAVKAYRKALRDLPEQTGFPWTDDTVPWPVKPVITIRER